MTFRNKLLLEVLVVGGLTTITALILTALDIGAVIGSVIALYALLYLLVFGYLFADA